MAIFHCQTKPLSRSGGRSAVAASAYRAGVELTDERTGVVHNFTRRSGVESADLLLPEGAPDLDRGELWNHAEAAEVRKDARTAREWVIALPSELDPAGRRALALEFAGKLVDRYGVAVDVAIHKPGKKGDDRNHHAHLLATTRQIGPEGFGAKADLELSDKARIARGLTPARKEIEAVRALWAGLANEYLERAGRSERIDHRSLKAQGIEREPTKHLGPAATAIERANKQSRLRAEHQEAAAFKQASTAELATEAKTVSAELAALLEHRAALERQQVEQAARHRVEIAIQQPTALLQEGVGLHRRDFGTIPKVPTIEQPTVPGAAAIGAVIDAKLAAWTPEQRAKLKEMVAAKRQEIAQDPEAVYASLLKPILRAQQKAAAATIVDLQTERQQWTQAVRDHQGAEPRMFGRKQWERAGVALDSAGRDIAQREGIALTAADPRAIERAAVAELRHQAPAVVEAAEQARKAREAREQEARRLEQEKRRAEYEKAQAGKEFNSMALSRQMKGYGYTDHSDKWRALPEELKQKIEAYNRLPKEQQTLALEHIGKEPRIAELLKEVKEISRSQERGR